VIADSKASPNATHVADLGTRTQSAGKILPIEERAGCPIETKTNIKEKQPLKEKSALM
jgi:uncharacterized protein YpuA (DUF1002 family)